MCATCAESSRNCSRRASPCEASGVAASTCVVRVRVRVKARVEVRVRVMVRVRVRVKVRG